MALSIDQVKRILEAALLFGSEPISIKELSDIFNAEDEVNANAIEDLLKVITDDYRGRGIELVKVASGYRFQICEDLSPWITRMMAEKPARYSRALLETLALVAYKQPITRAEIEQVRGVAVSTNIMRTLQEREWIKVIGHRDVPGKPALYATTKKFLDDLNLNSLSDLPTLAQLQDLDDGQLTQQLDLQLSEAGEESEHIYETQTQLADETPAEILAESPTETQATESEHNPVGATIVPFFQEQADPIILRAEEISRENDVTSLQAEGAGVQIDRATQAQPYNSDEEDFESDWDEEDEDDDDWELDDEEDDDLEDEEGWGSEDDDYDEEDDEEENWDRDEDLDEDEFDEEDEEELYREEDDEDIRL